MPDTSPGGVRTEDPNTQHSNTQHSNTEHSNTEDRRPVVREAPSTADPGPWRGAVEWRPESGWSTAWRLVSRLELRDRLRDAAESSTGVRAVLHTDATRLTLPVRLGRLARGVVDVLVDGELWQRTQLVEGTGRLDVPLPGRPARVEVWLPHDGRVGVGQLEVTGASVVEDGPGARPRWFAYGSSITHCGAAMGPSETWPALVARRHDWDLTCLGFNGQALLDLPVAHTIAAAAPDLVTLCVGINIFNQATMTPEELRGRLIEFIEIIRADGLPRPVAVMSPICSPSREEAPNAVGMTLQSLRELVADVVDELGGSVTHVPGLEVFGPADQEFLSDGLHPDAAGYRLMGDRLTPILGGWGARG